MTGYFFMWFHFLMLLCITLIFSDERGANQATSHYLNQCWNIVNSHLRNTFQWNLQRNSYHFIQENAFEMVVWNMAAILSRPQCVNKLYSSDTTNLLKKLTNQIVTMACKVSSGSSTIYWGLHKMANILHLHSKCIFLRGNFCILYADATKVSPWGSNWQYILVEEIMTWHWKVTSHYQN